ncbi:MAG: circadian clock protein KaiC [Euryarchaeota archaeon]|nr:circadian clock protein KaiC [Euryarchaeota archaeon]
MGARLVLKIKTYIEGFDDKMNGGVPKGNVVIIAGEPGTLKSSIAFYLLYNNAKCEGRVGAYITLEQGRESLVQQLDSLGMDPTSVESKVSLVDLALIRKNMDKLGQQTWMQIFKTYTNNLKESLDYELLVIDSLQVLEMLGNLETPRQDLFHFFEWLRDLKVTTFIISETKAGSDVYAEKGEDFLSDGIIHLKMDKVDDVNVQRRIRCVKMRGTGHSTNYYTLLFQNGVFQATRVIGE